jgi:hypothetical protein
MERFDEDEIFYLDEAKDKRFVFKYITPDEFQFIYDCIQGEFKGIVPYNSKVKLEEKIIAYLDPNIELKSIDFEKFTKCEEAKENLKSLEVDEKRVNFDVKLYCNDIPKFMNIHVSNIFKNLLSVTNRGPGSLFDDFVTLHINIFTNFFINRERKISKNEPYIHLYRQLVNMYDDTFDKKNTLMYIETNKTNNFIYNTYREYQTKDNSLNLKKSEGYSYDCSEKTTTIEKLLCALTHKRETKESFKFEKRFEHSSQFKSYKGGVKFNLKGKEGLTNVAVVVKKGEDETLQVLNNNILNLYKKIFNVIFNDKDIEKLFKLCVNNPDRKNLDYCLNLGAVSKLKELFKDNLQVGFINTLNRNVKGDVATTKPIYDCGDKENIVIGIDKKIELKYFEYDEIMIQKNRTVHLTRILEPNEAKIKDSIKTDRYIKNSKEFDDFFSLVLNTLVDTLLESLNSFFKLIVNKSKRTEGLIIAGPKYIKNNNDWKFKLSKGDDYQRGFGAAINLLLPPNPETWDFEYSYETGLFCLRKS